jgi:prenylcysteine alpha-carboxyl methylesterase
MSIKPLLSRSSSFNSIGVGVNSFYQKRRRRVASEDSLSFVSNGTSSSSNRSSSSFGRDVRHVASETYLITRLGLKMLSYLGYGISFFHSFHLYK